MEKSIETKTEINNLSENYEAFRLKYTNWKLHDLAEKIKAQNIKHRLKYGEF